VAGGAARRSAAGDAASAGTNTSGACGFGHDRAPIPSRAVDKTVRVLGSSPHCSTNQSPWQTSFFLQRTQIGLKILTDKLCLLPSLLGLLELEQVDATQLSTCSPILPNKQTSWPPQSGLNCVVCLFGAAGVQCSFWPYLPPPPLKSARAWAAVVLPEFCEG
jgi:hypothetical protein